MNLYSELLKGVLCLIWLCCLPLNTNSNYQKYKNNNEKKMRKLYNLCILD